MHHFFLILRFALGALFIYAGVLKVMAPSTFLADVRSFHILGDPWAAWLALGLPWLEIITGCTLLAGIFEDTSLFIITAMLTTFLVAILYSWQRGLDITCGCFGKSSRGPSVYAELIGRDIALLLAVLTLVVHRIKNLRVLER